MTTSHVCVCIAHKLVEIKAIEEEYAKGNTDLHGSFLLDSI